MPDWTDKSIFSIDLDETEENDRESSNLLSSPKLSQRTIQRPATSTPQSPTRAFNSRQPLLSDPLSSPSTAIEMQTAEEKIRYATSSGQTPPKQSFLDKLFGRPEPSAARTFNIGTGEDLKSHFPPNIIRNQKYHPSTLVLVVLYNQVRPALKGFLIHKKFF